MVICRVSFRYNAQRHRIRKARMEQPATCQEARGCCTLAAPTRSECTRHCRESKWGLAPPDTDSRQGAGAGLVHGGYSLLSYSTLLYDDVIGSIGGRGCPTDQTSLRQEGWKE